MQKCKIANIALPSAHFKNAKLNTIICLQLFGCIYDFNK